MQINAIQIIVTYITLFKSLLGAGAEPILYRTLYRGWVPGMQSEVKEYYSTFRL